MTQPKATLVRFYLEYDDGTARQLTIHEPAEVDVITDHEEPGSGGEWNTDLCDPLLNLEACTKIAVRALPGRSRPEYDEAPL